VSKAALLAIRADASEHIGSGHVMRCLSLAEEWASRGGAVIFLCRPLKGHLVPAIQERGFETRALSLGDAAPTWTAEDQRADAWATRQVLSELIHRSEGSAVWLLVDHYQLGAAWHEAVTQQGMWLAVLDDLANRTLKCDVLIDQNALTHLHLRYPALTPAHCQRLLGADYTLLRQDVVRAAKQRDHHAVRVVPVFMGGADREGLTQTVIDHWRRQVNREDLTAHVLCGAMNPHREGLKTACMQAQISFSHAQRDMSAVLTQARAAIVACGMLAVELQALEVPSLLIPLSDIQKAVAFDFEKRGRAVVLNPENLRDDDAFDSAWLRTLALDYSYSGEGFIALDGARKVVNRLMEISS
jgi:UDP-2,4-diacetamido-2,4,6-trideoxy-beta-L-altropyranose hydrolase